MTAPSTYHPLRYTVEKLADLPFYTEGPALDREGNIFFTTLSGKTIFRLGNTVLKQWGHSPCPNGQVICANGDHLICDSKRGAIRQFNAGGTFCRDIIYKKCSNRKVVSPNDLVLDNNEGIYFTDSIRDEGAVYYCTKDGHQSIVAEKLDYPNGLVLSADEKSLFIAESYQNRILRVNIKEPGIAAGSPEVFAVLPQHKEKGYNLPDGLATDKEGNIFAAHYGMQAIQVFSAAGGFLFSIDTGLPLTSNLVFSDEGTLIVTGGYKEPGPGAVVRIQFPGNSGMMDRGSL